MDSVISDRVWGRLWNQRAKCNRVIGVGAQRARRELTKMLGIEEIVGPGNLVVGIVEQAIRTGSGG